MRIKQWADSHINTSGKITLTPSQQTIYDLEIVGKGYDDRCTWCDSFRTTLQSEIKEIFTQQGDCFFKSTSKGRRLSHHNNRYAHQSNNVESVQVKATYQQLIKLLNKLKREEKISAKEWRTYRDQWQKFPHTRKNLLIELKYRAE